MPHMISTNVRGTSSEYVDRLIIWTDPAISLIAYPEYKWRILRAIAFRRWDLSSIMKISINEVLTSLGKYELVYVNPLRGDWSLSPSTCGNMSNAVHGPLDILHIPFSSHVKPTVLHHATHRVGGLPESHQSLNHLTTNAPATRSFELIYLECIN